jgi:prepilin signal peptidase PulO-like enzyme (type II secretory pathway)
VNVILAIPFQVRLVLVFLAGAVLASLVNLLVDRQRELTPRYSPWNDVLDRLLGRNRAKPASQATAQRSKHAARARKAKGVPPPRKPGKFALLPIIGWVEVAATAPTNRPRRFWLRPMIVELLFAAGITVLYWAEVGRGALVPADLGSSRLRVPLNMAEVVHQQFALHAILLTFMLAASLIDLDEWIIPDAIAITGTLVALGLAIAAPNSALLVTIPGLSDSVLLIRLDFTAPGDLVRQLESRQPLAMILALGCVWLWCFAQLPRVWTLRWGWGVAVKIFFRRLAREQRATKSVLLIGVLLSVVCALVWWYGDVRWTALLSALIGLTVGSGIIWTIRIICSAILKREAMGFGDVTLMAMIGAFLGWQPTLLAFFLSPFFGLIPPIVAILMRSRAPQAVPYGPFLCLGAATVLLCWAKVWPWLADKLDLFTGQGGGIVLVIVLGLLVALAVLLILLQLVKRLFTRSRSQAPPGNALP